MRIRMRMRMRIRSFAANTKPTHATLHYITLLSPLLLSRSHRFTLATAPVTGTLCPMWLGGVVTLPVVKTRGATLRVEVVDATEVHLGLGEGSNSMGGEKILGGCEIDLSRLGNYPEEQFSTEGEDAWICLQTAPLRSGTSSSSSSTSTSTSSATSSATSTVSKINETGRKWKEVGDGGMVDVDQDEKLTDELNEEITQRNRTGVEKTFAAVENTVVDFTKVVGNAVGTPLKILGGIAKRGFTPMGLGGAIGAINGTISETITHGIDEIAVHSMKKEPKVSRLEKLSHFVQICPHTLRHYTLRFTSASECPCLK